MKVTCARGRPRGPGWFPHNRPAPRSNGVSVSSPGVGGAATHPDGARIGAAPAREVPLRPPLPVSSQGRGLASRLVRSGPVGILTVAAALVSAYRLGSSPMWSDEVASVSISVQHGHALWSAVASDGGSMSAYYLLLHTLFLVGMGQSPVPVRLASVVAFVATVPFLYGLVRRCWGSQVAVVATAIVVTNRMVITKAQEARGYALGLLLVVVAAWLLTIAVERISTPRLVAWAVVSALACYSLLLSPLFAVAQFLSLGTLRRRGGLVRAAVIAAVAAALAVVPLALMALNRGTAQIDWIAPLSTGAVKGFLYGLVVPWFPTWLRWLMLVVIVVGVVRAVLEAARSEAGSLERWQRVLWLSWAGFPLAGLLAISSQASLLQSDYLIASVPAFAVLATLGITTVAKWAAARAGEVIEKVRAGRSSPERRVLFAGSVLVAVVAALVVVNPLVRSWGRYGAVIENGPGVTRLVVSLARPGDAIIFDQPAQRMIFNYYLLAHFDKAGRLPLLPVPVWPADAWGSQLPYAADHRLPTPAAIAALDGRFTRIWVVDGGWAPLKRYLAQSRVMLATLHRGYPVAGEADLKGVKVLLFSTSGPLPPGMHAWAGGT